MGISTWEFSDIDVDETLLRALRVISAREFYSEFYGLCENLCFYVPSTRAAKRESRHPAIVVSRIALLFMKVTN